MPKKKAALKTESLTTLMKIRHPWKQCSKKLRSLQLITSASAGHLAEVSKLMKMDVDLGSTDERGRTALHQATMNGHLEVVEVLLTRWKGPVQRILMKKDSSGYASVHIASVSSNKGMMRLLLNRGADPTSKTYFGETALHLAAHSGNYHALHTLLDRLEVHIRRSLLETRDVWGATALHYAAEKGHLAATKLLLAYGADLNATDRARQTALHRSAQKNYARVVEALLLKGADFTAKDENNMTPEEVAPSGSVCQQLLSGHEQHYPSLQRLCRMNIHAALGEIREEDVQAMSWLAPPLQNFLLFKNAL